MEKTTIAPIIFCFLLITSCTKKFELKIDAQNDWEENTAKSDDVTIKKSDDLNGVVDLMGNGALLLKKLDNGKPFQKTSIFRESGTWISKWQELNQENIHFSKSLID